MSQETLLTVSLFFSFAAYPVYAYGIYREGARPTRPTWIMILITDLLLFYYMWLEARWDWLLLGYTAGNLVMLAIMAWSDIQRALRNTGRRFLGWHETTLLAFLGRDQWTKKDVCSVGVALSALALWGITGSGVMAICFSLAGKIEASVPMFINLYREPDREKLLPWAMWGVGGLLYVLAIPSNEWRFVSLATPILFVILEAIVITLLLRQPKYRFAALAG